MASERGENDQQVVPKSFRGHSFSSCSNVLNDADEELTRSRENNSGTIRAKTTHPQHQSNTTRPVTFKDNPNQAQFQAIEQERWNRDEEKQGEWQEEAEETVKEEPASELENNKTTGPERPRPSRLQEELAALRRSPAHWAKFEYLTRQVSFAGFEKDGKTRLDESQCVRLAASDTPGPATSLGLALTQPKPKLKLKKKM